MKKSAYLLSIFLIAILVAVLLAGCTSPTPTSAPAVTATPSAGLPNAYGAINSSTATSGAASTPTSAPLMVPTTQAGKTTLTVFAGSSLSNAFNETAANFTALHPEANVVYDFDSSTTLQTQIENGAPADVFASAATSNMNKLKSEGLMNNTTIVNFAKNKLALIVPAGNPENVTSLADLNRSGLKIIVCDPSVPCGKYTVQMMQNLSNNSAYGPTYVNQTTANEKPGALSANAAVVSIANDEGDVGIVYASDVPAQYQSQVTVIPIPDSLNVIATYPIGVTSGSPNQALAEDFVNYVTSSDGQTILQDNNFLPPA